MKPLKIYPLLATLALILLPTHSTNAGSFVPTNSLATARQDHTATLLANGKILITGGDYLSSAELYNPSTGTWSGTSDMTDQRANHTATLLSNGKVLVAGGMDNIGTTNTAELYDPAAGTWMVTGSMTTARQSYTATLLPDGKVLVAGGGQNLGNVTSTAELYDPATGTWMVTGGMSTAREAHTATLLPNGKVLISGGFNSSIMVTNAELYDPVAGTWTPAGAMNAARAGHTATLLPSGKVLVAGGYDFTGGFTVRSSAELYDPATGVWTPTSPMNTERYSHTATLLPNGNVLVVGGAKYGDYVVGAELYDPSSGTWTPTGPPTTVRAYHTATLLTDGRVMVAGGATYNGDISSGAVIASVEIYSDSALPSWTATGPLTNTPSYHQAVLLTNGQVLVMGGVDRFNNQLSNTRLYDASTGAWTPSGSMLRSRFYGFTAVALANGKVLVAGGYDTSISASLSNAEVYNPATGTWAATGPMITPRSFHTATLLPNGKVLVAGGSNNGDTFSSAEIYDPLTGTWTATGSLPAPRAQHAAILLANGKVLLAGGADSSSTGELLYDSATGTWSPTGLLSPARGGHILTLLPNGKVLVTGGAGFINSSFTSLPNADLYDPASGTWTPTGALNNARQWHTATLLTNGTVMVAGGAQPFIGPLASTELYDPVVGTWTATDGMNNPRSEHTATLLPNGKVLVAGGNGRAYLPSAELYAVPVPISNPPTLSMLVASNTITISWTPNTAGFVLQQNDSLDPLGWTNAPSGNTNPVTLATDTQQRFFRLFKP